MGEKKRERNITAAKAELKLVVEKVFLGNNAGNAIHKLLLNLLHPSK